MSRVGWVVLALILLFGAMLLSVTRCGGPVAPRPEISATSLPVDPAAGQLVVPVAGVARSSIQNNWGDPRAGGLRRHHGIDIMAPGGTPVLAAASGQVEKLFSSVLGGTTLYLRSQDRGWVYYYAHLSGYAPGIHEGQRVAAGDRLGFVGDTGDAGAGNYHLHFGMQRMRPGERWWQGEDVNPYPELAGSAARR